MDVRMGNLQDLLEEFMGERRGNRMPTPEEIERYTALHEQRVEYLRSLWSDDSEQSKTVQTFLDSADLWLKATITGMKCPALLWETFAEYGKVLIAMMERIEDLGRFRCDAVEHFGYENPAPKPEAPEPHIDVPENWDRFARDAS